MSLALASRIRSSNLPRTLTHLSHSRVTRGCDNYWKLLESTDNQKVIYNKFVTMVSRSNHYDLIRGIPEQFCGRWALETDDDRQKCSWYREAELMSSRRSECSMKSRRDSNSAMTASTSSIWHQHNHKFKKKRSEETQTMHAGCSKVEPKKFAGPQTPFPGAQYPLQMAEDMSSGKMIFTLLQLWLQPLQTTVSFKLIGCPRLRNDLYCVEWDVKP